MLDIRYVSEADKAFWFTLDAHISESELMLKIRDKRGYVFRDGNDPAGIMRYNLFWDMIPFLTFIYFPEHCRKKGFGRQAVRYWESEMQRLGYTAVMTSTQVDEQAQHFYRKLGYKDMGGLFLYNTPFEQPQELFMMKIL